MACNSPGRKITDLDGVGGKAKETTSARAMTRAVVSSIPVQGFLGAMPDDDALGLPLIDSAGTDRASPKKTPCLPPIRPSAIVKPFGVILLAASRANRRLARRRAVDKAKVAKVTSFGASCQFDENGLRLIQSEAELQKILTAIHYHEGAQALHGIVRGIVSPHSPGGVGSGLLQRCRDFVRGCESCQMCRRLPGKRQSKELSWLESRELAMKPIRISLGRRWRFLQPKWQRSGGG